MRSNLFEMSLNKKEIIEKKIKSIFLQV